MQVTDKFHSRFGFLMAATGFAVGLGNIWRFPYITGENGGGAFILIYLLCTACIGIPALMAELLIGRRGEGTPPVSLSTLARARGASPRWVQVGYLNLATALFIMATYAAVGGQVLSYLYGGLVDGFAGTDATRAVANFAALQADIPGMLLWTFVMLFATGFIVYLGVNQGIERLVSLLMPMLLLFSLALVVFNIYAGGFLEAAIYLLTPDFSKLSGSVFLDAVGQTFFSVGIAMAGMMTFSAYLPRSVSIVRASLAIVAIDTGIALVAGFMIFPMVFRFGLDPASGAGLIFETLPVAFAQMPAGQVIGCVFFLLLSVAAVTSMVGLIEPLAAWSSHRFGLGRRPSTLLVIGLIVPLSCVSVLSYSVIADWQIAGFNFNGILDFLSNQLMLPVGALLIVLFAGWVLRPADLMDELQLQEGPLFTAWHLLVRFLVPLALLVILVTGLM